MLHRRNCRIAHSSPEVSPKTSLSYSSSSPLSSNYGSFSLPSSPPTTSTSCGIGFSKSRQPQKKYTFTVRRRALRMRPSLLLRVLKKLKAIVTIETRAGSSESLIKREGQGMGSARFGTGLSGYCTHSSCAPDAIADCIEFIKRTSSLPSPPS